MRMAKQKGFTIIELVIVIIILGILAAFAVPRFAGLATSARISTVQGLEGSIRSAAALAHAKQLADNGAPAASITMDGQTVTMINRYPTGDAAGIGVALQSTTGFTVTYASSTATFTKDGADATATCVVTYTAPAAANTAPTITSTITGC